MTAGCHIITIMNVLYFYYSKHNLLFDARKYCPKPYAKQMAESPTYITPELILTSGGQIRQGKQPHHHNERVVFLLQQAYFTF